MICRECRRPKCRFDKDCPFDQYCEKNHLHDCVDKCKSDSHCERNEVCIMGRCLVRECKNHGSICKNGKHCKDIQCHCQRGFCVPNEKCYKTEYKCRDGTYCGIDGSCIADHPCNIMIDNECPLHLECNVEMGICLPPRRTISCIPGRGNECSRDQKCSHISAICIPRNALNCKRTEDCPGDDECDEGGICLPTRRILFCKSHADCSVLCYSI